MPGLELGFAPVGSGELLRVGVGVMQAYEALAYG